MTTPICTGTNKVAQVVSRATLCPDCRRWVSLDWAGDKFVQVPAHEAPSALDIQRAANIIQFEYHQARKNGTLIVDPDRWHTTALGMVLPSHAKRA